MHHNLMPLIILCLPFVGAVVSPALSAGQRWRAAGMMIGTAAFGLLLTLLLLPAITQGEVLRQSLPWAPALGLEFILRVDGLAWMFLLLICGIGLLVGIYAVYYMPSEDSLVRFFSLLLAFMGAMLGIVLAGNVIQLAFFWELTSLFSFLLIGYWHQGESARDAARTALIVTGAGGLCLLAGLLLLGHVVGSYDLDVILQAGEQIRSSSLYVPLLVLILLGALAKSAQFPFHFWLPLAMSAPTPVSASLHSATMVKAGVFLLLRLWPVLAGTEPWFWIVGSAGMLSLLGGAWVASFQHDLKAILAYSTISHLGLITMLAGLGNRLGAAAAIFHIVNHATFKASLFMAAGAVDNEAGTRDLRRLGGLRHVMPITATLAIIAAAAMAGVPLLNGFLSKEMFFAVTLGPSHGLFMDVATALMAVAAAALGVTYSVRLIGGTFFGTRRDDYPRRPQEPPRWMRFPIGLLALICLAVGIMPALIIGPTLRAAAVAVLGPQLPSYSLRIWHGWTAPLLMSMLAFAIGCLFYFAFRRRFARFSEPPLTHWLSARLVFERLLVWLTATLPGWQSRLFPERRPQLQLLLIAVLASFVVLLLAPLPFAPVPEQGIDPAFVLVWLVGGASAIGAATEAKFDRLAALTLTGAAGLVVCV